MSDISTEPVDAPRNAPFAKRNIFLLSLTQAISGSNQAIVMAVGALTGAAMAPNASLATLPTTAMIIGLALMAIPATFTIHRLGRRNGFMIGAGFAIVAGLVASFAVSSANFILFSGALVFVGASSAFGQQYRFAVADSVHEAWKARAISFVLLGGVLAGFLGPRLSFIAKDLVAGGEFAGSYLVISMLATIALVVLVFTRLAPTHKKSPDHEYTGRPLKILVRSPDIFVPIISAMASYALMTFVMVSAPLAMVLQIGHNVETATTAIQWHIIAMFGPSFVTGYVINRIGGHTTAAFGLFLIIMSALVSLSGTTAWHFYIALVLLGSGWNFGFIGSTTLLTNSYRPEEAARVQGLNEQLVFGAMAIASIGSGVLVQLIGWQSVNIMVIPIATAAITLLLWGGYRVRKLAAPK